MFVSDRPIPPITAMVASSGGACVVVVVVTVVVVVVVVVVSVTVVIFKISQIALVSGFFRVRCFGFYKFR